MFKLERVRPAVVAAGLAEAQVRFRTVPILFCENRKLAQEWTYRFLGAGLPHVDEHRTAERATAELPLSGPAPGRRPTAREIREWARSVGNTVSDRGRIPVDVRQAVSLCVADHEMHQHVSRALDGRRLGLAGHAAFETFSVLTRLPPPARRPPVIVDRLLRENFPASRFLSAAAASELITRFGEGEISGGAVYDALVGATAIEHGLALATLDRRALDTYRVLGVQVELLDPMG